MLGMGYILLLGAMLLCSYVTLNYSEMMFKKGEEFNSLFLLLVSVTGIIIITFLGIPGALVIKTMKKVKKQGKRSFGLSS